MKSNSCVVTIPVYKEIPSKAEEASFKQCLTILRNYDIVIYTYPELDSSAYRDISEEVGKAFGIEYFEKKCFTSVRNYNRLCLDYRFYERFLKYDYLLIYQLDAWVFRDELQMWCNKGYDYIGAPLYEREDDSNYGYNIIGVGNGGFSLRRVQYCLSKLRRSVRYLPVLTPEVLFQLYKIERNVLKNQKKKWHPVKFYSLATCKFLLRVVGVCNNMSYFYHDARMNEDLLFGAYSLKSYWGRPQLPTLIEAKHFSFEVHPSKLYEETGHKLPFGCHAFEKYEYNEFWKRYIKVGQ